MTFDSRYVIADGSVSNIKDGPVSHAARKGKRQREQLGEDKDAAGEQQQKRLKSGAPKDCMPLHMSTDAQVAPPQTQPSAFVGPKHIGAKSRATKSRVHHMGMKTRAAAAKAP